MSEGGCFCAAIRYRISGEVANSMVCHCRSCRRAAGAPVVAWITVASGAFEFTRGRPAEYRSSPGVTRGFCAACGTALTYRHAERSDHVDVTTCSLDEPERHPPTHHSWVGDDLPWARFGDGLPQFAKFRGEGGTG